MHLPDFWHLNPERNSCADERRDPYKGDTGSQGLAPRRLVNHLNFTEDNPHWDTSFDDEHDMRRRAYFGACSSRRGDR